MTTVKFLFSGEILTGFEIDGHSTESAEDAEGKLVCAAVSSAAYMTANTVIEVIGDKYSADIKDGFMRFCAENPSDASVKVMEGLRLHITELKKQYGKRIKIITEV